MHPPFLLVDETRLKALDPQSPDDLSRMWSVFSKASQMLENGERLKNLSWRLWNRETLCCVPSRRATRALSDSSATTDHSSTSQFSSLRLPAEEPELSRSVDSASSTDSHDVVCEAKASHPNERHITPLDLQNLVHSIKNKQLLPTPIPQPRPTKGSQQPQKISHPAPPLRSASPPHPAQAESSTSTVATATDSFESIAPASETSVSSDGSSSHSVVRGFTPGTGVTSYTSKTQLAPAAAPAPILKKSPPAPSATIKKKAGMFMLGGSSGEDDESFRDRMSPPSRPSQRASDGSRKQTSFKDEVLVMRDKRYEQDHSSPEWESDSEAVESAIEDDDDAWEDDESETKDEDSKKELKFFRVDSKANLTSRRSALTLNLEEQRSGRHSHSSSTPALRRSRTSTPNGPSMPASPTEEAAIHLASKMQTSKPIMTTSNMQPTPAVASPRTTRRHMLAGELSESLRRNMLSERQQKNPLGISNIKRAHTAFDVSKLSRLPETSEPSKPTEGSSIPSNIASHNRMSWNHYFDNSVGEYHQAGW